MYSVDDISNLIRNTLGSDDAQVVLDTLNLQLEQVPPMQTEGKTWGDWAFTVPYLKEELRPWTALSYQNIDLMLRTGIIRFAVDLKRAKMVSPFRNERSLQLISPDKELADASLAALVPLLPQLMYELSWSSLVYGSAFIETVWGTKTGYQLGIDERRTSRLWSVPVGFNLVPHKTVRAIKRLENGQFDGFVQNPAFATHYYPADQRTAGLIIGNVGPNDIVVGPDAALVVPYNGYSRQLWGESFLTPIFPLWFWYEIIMRCLVSYAQLMGDPPRLGKAPSKKKLQITTTGQIIDAVDYIMAVGVNLSKSNTAVIPSDVDPETKVPQYDLAYMTVPERSQPFVQILEYMNQQILRAALSSDKTLISSPGGGGAIGEIHAEATALHDEMITSSWLYYINKYFVNYLSIYNRGMDGPPIRLEIQGLDPREQQLLQSVMGVAGNTKSFDDFFYQVDWKSLGNLAGLPMLTEEQKAELKQKLQAEGLQNQMAQQEVAAQGETGFPPKDEQKKLEQKIDQLLERPPLVLSREEVAKLKPVIEEEPKVYQINAPINKRKQVAAVVASLLMEGGIDDDSPFRLFNPYHDETGRFTVRPSQAFLFGGGGTTYSPGKIAQSIDGVKKDYGPLVDFKTVSCSDMACVKKNTGSSNPNVLGSFGDGKLVLAPNIGSLTDRVVTHEGIHARKRSQGGAIRLRSNMHRQVEEGCTELMTFRKVKGDWRQTPYRREILTVASAARRFSNGDPKKAWKFVKDVHYYNDTDIGVSAIAKYQGSPSQADVEWMLGNKSIGLERTDEERFRLSEEAIYADIREVGNEQVDLNVPLPEEFNVS